MTDDEFDDNQLEIRKRLQRDVANAYLLARDVRGDALRLALIDVPGLRVSLGEDESKNILRAQALAQGISLYERITRDVESFEEVQQMSRAVAAGSPRRICEDCTHTLEVSAKFSPGTFVVTPGAATLAPTILQRCLLRHVTGDWGIIVPDDAGLNDMHAAREHGRIHSAYAIDESKPSSGFGDNTLWVITESDRSLTTALLPDEY